MPILAHKIRLCTDTDEQAEEYFERACGVARHSFNWGLAKWDELYAAGERPTWQRIDREYNAIKEEEFPWAYEVTKCAAQGAIQDLGTAFKNMFAGRAGRPKFKKKNKTKPSFYISNSDFQVDVNFIRIPHLGWVRMIDRIRFPGKIMGVTISKEADGGWYASFQVCIDETKWAYPHRCESQASVGVDLGLLSIITLSDGTKLSYPVVLERLYKQVRVWQRAMSRREYESKNWEKARKKVAMLWLEIRRIRDDWAHRLTTWLVKNFRVIGLETLNILGMMKNCRLARKIGEACWGEICRQLVYKTELAGGTLVRMDRWYPSTKTCSTCGHKLDELPLSVRCWTCPACGVEHDRDVNAALNMKHVAEQVAWEPRETQNARGGERETNACEGYGSPVEAGNPL